MMKDYMRVDPEHPFVGLDNQICRSPRHYCCYHDVWLSEADVRKRGCRRRIETENGRKRCRALKENHYDKSINALIRKTRPCTDKRRAAYYR